MPAMSKPVMQDALYPSPHLMKLPAETLDEIASYIDLHKDLLSLALASNDCAKLVIPRQIQYRVIRVRHATPLLWAHLARRADLARNVREVHICDRLDFTASDRFPTKLIDKGIDGAKDNFQLDNAMNNLCRALRHMKHLHTFTWSCAEEVNPMLPLNKPYLEERFLSALRDCPALEHLALKGRFGLFARSNYPLWTFSNLRSLSLSGNTWTRSSNVPGLLNLFARCPGLEFLDVPMELPQLNAARLPSLSHVELHLYGGATPHVDFSIAEFLHHHPTITSLSWHPFALNKFVLPNGVLPSLKRVSTNHHLLSALDEGALQGIEFLDIQYLDVAHLEVYKRLGIQDTLTTLSVRSFGNVETLTAIPDHFPKLKRLYLPAAYNPQTAVPRNVWIGLLSRLPDLEIFRGNGLWVAVEGDKSRMHELIGDLAGLCPKLVQLDHCAIDDKTNDWKRICIVREDRDGEQSVRYEVTKPPERKWFSGIDRMFY